MKRLGPFFDRNAQHLTVQSTHSQLVAMDDWGKGGHVVELPPCHVTWLIVTFLLQLNKAVWREVFAAIKEFYLHTHMCQDQCSPTITYEPPSKASRTLGERAGWGGGGGHLTRWLCFLQQFYKKMLYRTGQK